MGFYDRVSGLLAEQRKSKRQMSMAINMPYTTLASMFQRRSTSIDIELAKKMAMFLNTTIEYLISGNEQHKTKELPSNLNTAINLLNKLNEKELPIVIGFLQGLLDMKEEIKRG